MKNIFLTLVALCAIGAGHACEICGCSSGNYFIGPFPVFQKHFAGVRYTFRSFDTRLKSDATQFSRDFYQTAEIWGGVNINKRWQILGFVPYNINKQNSDDGVKTNKGLGDVSFILNYNLLSSSKIDKDWKVKRQQLWIGGGLKLPTGKFEADANSLVPSANNQVGTGSVDFILSSIYSLSFKQFTFSSNATYKINKDAKTYHFGNRFAANAFGSYTISSSKATFSPNVGLLYETLKANEVNKVKVQDTGGNALIGAAGLEISFNNFSVGFNAQLPASENISSGQTHTRINGMVHLTFSL